MEYIKKWHINVSLCIDIFYVNQMEFFHIQFRTVEYIASESKDVLLKCLNKVLKIYKIRGFKIEYVCADKQFQCLEDDILPVWLQIASKGEHVPEIERSIQAVKGDNRTALHALPFKKYPPILIKGMVLNQVAIRNKFPQKNGISEHMGPFSILTGHPQPSYADFKLEFGQYVQTHDHPD